MNVELQVERWNQFGLLKGLSKERKQAAAVMLENQHLENERLSVYDSASWIRLNIPLVRRVVGVSVTPDIVGVQPQVVLGEPYDGAVYYNHTNENGTFIRQQEVLGQPHKYKAMWVEPEAVEARWKGMQLSLEAEMIAIYAQEIALEMDHRTIRDLMNSVKCNEIDLSGKEAWGYTVSEKIETLYRELREISIDVQSKCGHAANWIIASPDVLEMIGTSSVFESSGEHAYNLLGARCGTFAKRWAVYRDPLMQNGNVVMGYKGETAEDAGYIVAPFVPFLPPSRTEGRLSTVESRVFVDGGQDYYRRLKIKM